MTFNRHLKKVLALAQILPILGLFGCVTTSKRTVPMTSINPPVHQPPPPGHNPGSLFSLNQPMTLFEDNRARRIGDLVTVLVTENTYSKNKIETKNDRTSGNERNVDAFFGSDRFNMIPILNQSGRSTGGGEILHALSGDSPLGTITKNDVDQKFKTKGETKRESRVTTAVGCRIVNILPGGVMQIEGARTTKVNDDTQILAVRGLIRPTDISKNNEVDSNAIANAEIELYGEGSIADRQKPGWLTRLLDNIWPF